MILKILLLTFGIPVLILPLLGSIVKDRRMTKLGYYFISSVILFTLIQLINETNNSKEEKVLQKDKTELKHKVDSLNLTANSLRDSIYNLRNILLSIDNQLYITNNELVDLGNKNNSLNKIIFETDRPIFHLTSTEIKKSSKFKYNYVIEFYFRNEGVRAVTNVHGRMFTIHGDTIIDNGTLSISQFDVYPHNKGFIIHSPLNFNPNDISLSEPIYYYFELKYSDMTTKQVFPYEIVMKLNSYENGNFLNELVLCRNWEEQKIKKKIK